MEEFANQSITWLDALELGPWSEAAIIVFTGLLLAKLGDMLFVYVIGRMIARTRNKVDDQLVQLLHRPVFVSLAIIGLIVAVYNLGDELGDNFLSPTLAILKTIMIIVWLQFLLRAAASVVDSMGAHPTRFAFAQTDTVPLLKNLLIVLLLLAGAYSILVAWDINVTGLVASAGIVGLALSFAAQDTLSHLFAGVAILADRPYRIGDYIVLDTGERGQVKHIGLRSTRLMTRDDVEVSIPNGVMGSAKIVNESSGVERFRIRASVGVAYGTDVQMVLDILEDIAKNSEGICADPEPRARFRNFGNSSLDFELLAWIRDPAEQGLRVHQLNCAINERFKEAGVVIPFPQQDLWVRELPPLRDN